eukprot:scaffold633_cov288-Ochromonas_danica.AAC.43
MACAMSAQQCTGTLVRTVEKHFANKAVKPRPCTNKKLILCHLHKDNKNTYNNSARNHKDNI